MPKRTTKKNLTAATNVIPIGRHSKFRQAEEQLDWDSFTLNVIQSDRWRTNRRSR